MSTNKTVSLNFNCDPELKDTFQSLKETLGLKNNVDLLALLISNYQTSDASADFDLNDKEKETVNQAVATGTNYATILKSGLLSESKKIITQSTKLDALKVSMEEGQDDITTTLRGSAELRINRAVQAIFAHNDVQSEINKQWFISGTSIQKLTNSNMGAIKKYLENNHIEIDAHHAKHGLTDLSNRGRKGRSIEGDITV